MHNKKCLLIAAALLFSQTALAGSLYKNGAYRSLASDHRPYRVGDVITILILENAVASTSANTSTNKKGEIGGAIGGTLNTGAGSVDLGSDFKGGGKTERSGKLNARITVNVEQIMGNGDLVIKGKQFVSFNDEKQEIAIEGRIRPVDISPDNTVLSSRISDAQLSYSGKGILDGKQRQGILTRFLSWLKIL